MTARPAPSSGFRTAFLFAALLIGSALFSSALRASQIYADWAVSRFSDLPAQNSPLADPDGDGQANLIEFAFGTNPRSGDNGGASLIAPLTATAGGAFTVELFEREGRQPGIQIDLELAADPASWFRPAWQRAPLAALPGDPAGSLRESFTTTLPAHTNWFVRAAITVVDTGLESADYYVSPSGSDLNPGTFLAPFATIKKATDLAVAGQLIYIRGGTYPSTEKISLGKTAGAASPIRIRAYPGEHPILDFSAVAGTSLDGISISGSFYQLFGLEILGAPHNSIKISGNDNTVENCVSRAARNTGFHITGGTAATTYPARNLYLNCDSIRSFDAPIGGNADGFSAKWNLGLGNVFRGCRAIENSDDGWDLWMGDGSVLIDGCWAVRNGINVWNSATFDGNGQGFKLGGNNVGAPHRLVRSLSWGNRSYGIDQNNNPTGLTVDNNVCWNNASGALNLNHVGVTLVGNHTVRNNVAIAGTGKSTVSIGGTAPTIQNNSWQLLTGANAATLADFLDSDIATWMSAPRRDDGGLPDGPFMRPVPAGRLVDLGLAISGDPFSGLAPDLGAHESATW
jgi:Right handed beta helix region